MGINSDNAAIAKAIQKRNLTKSTNVLLGICSGLIADGSLNEHEIIFLSTWLEAHKEVASEWPGSAIYKRVREILEDGVITIEEQSSLVELLSGISGNQFYETGSPEVAAPGIPTNDEALVVFNEMTFCLTGEFAYGTRTACHSVIEKAGGIPAPRVTLDLDYLVVGSGCSPDWANTTYGRKIEQALKAQEKNGKPLIISEYRWNAALGDLDQ